MWRTKGTCCEEGGESLLVEMEALMWWSKSIHWWPCSGVGVPTWRGCDGASKVSTGGGPDIAC